MSESLLSTTGLSLERLRSFLTVADAGGIAQAAAGDVVKQSQYSRQLRELEAFFGAELTARKGRQLHISAHGRRLAELTRLHFQALEDFRREMADEPRSFSLGAGGSVLEWLLAPVFKEVSATIPSATWKLENHRSSELVDRIADGRLDFAIVRGDAVAQNLPRLKLATLSYVAAIPNKEAKRFAGYQQLSLSQLTTLPLALPTASGQMHEAIEEAFARAGLALRPAVVCQGSLQVHALVAAGSCAAILPSITPVESFTTFALPQMSSYKRPLVLHWNRRQMERRAIGMEVIRAMARELAI